jgi:hypothetical protein
VFLVGVVEVVLVFLDCAPAELIMPSCVATRVRAAAPKKRRRSHLISSVFVFVFMESSPLSPEFGARYFRKFAVF